MLDIFLCHSPVHSEAATIIASRLERCAEAKVWLEETESHLDSWEGGLSSAGILLLLSADSVPPKLSRGDWQPLLERPAEPPIGCVRMEDCPYPRLLERSNFFNWQTDPLPTLRGIEEWIISLHVQRGTASFSPSRLPWFTGRTGELATLWEALVDAGGATLTLQSETASGKTSLAQEFARQASAHYRDVLWVCCGNRPGAFVIGDLAAQLGATTKESVETLLQEHRVLAVFDDLTAALPIELPEKPRASVLITTRTGHVYGECMRLEPVPMPRPEIPASNAERELWRAMSVCDPCGFPIRLASSMAGVDQQTANGLLSLRLIDSLDFERFRMSASSWTAAREHADIETLWRKHADAVYRHLLEAPESCEAWASETYSALLYGCDSDWEFAKNLGRMASDLLRQRNRNWEAVEMLKSLLAAARVRTDARTVEMCEWELSWVQDNEGAARYPIAPGEQMQLGFSVI